MIIFPKNKNRSTLHPKTLFWVDSLGALFSTFMLGFVLVRLEGFFGMPVNTLYYLSLLASVFFTYSLGCFLFLKKNWKPYLKIIAILNLMYCCLTLALVVYWHQKLTLLGLIYFILEIIVIVILSTVELQAVSHQ